MCRSQDPHMPSYPTIIKLFNAHNHTLMSADSLKHKDVSSETVEKFLKLYEDGYSPFSALDIHKMDLQEEFGDYYYVKVADRSLCPDLWWCYR